MITIKTVTSIDYYRVKEAKIGEDRQDLGLGYYEQRGGSLGTLLRLVGPTGVGQDRDAGPFGSFRDGAPASFAIVERLGQGRDLRTGEVVIEPVATGRVRRGQRQSDPDKPTHVVAYDLTFSPEKAYSVLALLSSSHGRDQMLAIHDEAVEATLRLMAREGFILNRRGAQGRIRNPAAESCVAVYRHLTNRDTHPQLHSHAVLFNLCLRDDGGVGAIENRDLLIFKNACSALYRAELTGRLRERLGIETELSSSGPGIDIPGVPETATELFSQRRAAVVEDLAAKGLTSTDHREASDYSARRTRKNKDDTTPLTQLQRAWHAELAGIGFDIDMIWSQVERESAGRRTRRVEPGRGDPVEDHVRLSHEAFRETELIATRADILRIEAQTRQTRFSADEIVERARAREAELIALPRVSYETQRFLAPESIREEQALLKAAMAARGQWTPPPKAAIASVLTGSPASVEQRAAVRHMLNRDGVCIAEGAAGTGKTFVLKLLRRILDADQRRLLIAAPAWKAARLAGQESHVPVADAQALDPLIHAIQAGTEVIDRRTVIVVDEAGMAGSQDLQILVAAATAAGAKLILTGDTRQLQPVQRGAPMRALITLLGSHRLDEIRRQVSSWMRDASLAFASGNGAAGLQFYHDAGEIAVHRDRSMTLEASVSAYLDASIPVDPAWTTKALAQQLLITIRNEDVHELNRLVRLALIERGHLGPETITIEARGRGPEKHPRELELCVGDRVTFGRRIRLAPADIFNSDVATILSVDDGPDPHLTFELDRLDDNGKPIVLATRASALAVKDAKGGDSSIHLQHAYACTNYAAQGQTVDRAVVVNLSPMRSSDIYVACTRHRTSLSLHVDASRILPRRGSTVAGISRRGGFRGADEHGEQTARPLSHQDMARVIARIRQEADSQVLKVNPSDFIVDTLAWVRADDPVDMFRQRMQGRTDAQSLSRKPPGADIIKQLGKPERRSAAPIGPAQRGLPTPLSLSDAEQARLDWLPLLETCRHWFGGRVVGGHIFAHRRSGFALELLTTRVPWSRWADLTLRRRGAALEHRLVQAAVLFLTKSVRQARAFVRNQAGLWGYNPMARAAWSQARDMRQRKAADLLNSARLGVGTFEAAETDVSMGVKRRKAFLTGLARRNAAGVGKANDAFLTRESAASHDVVRDQRTAGSDTLNRSSHSLAITDNSASSDLCEPTKAAVARQVSMAPFETRPFMLDDDEPESTGVRRRKIAIQRAAIEAISRAAWSQARDIRQRKAADLLNSARLGVGAFEAAETDVSMGVKRRKAFLTGLARRNAAGVGKANDAFLTRESAASHDVVRDQRTAGSDTLNRGGPTPVLPENSETIDPRELKRAVVSRPASVPSFETLPFALDDDEPESTGVRRRKIAIRRKAALDAMSRATVHAAGPSLLSEPQTHDRHEPVQELTNTVRPSDLKDDPLMREPARAADAAGEGPSRGDARRARGIDRLDPSLINPRHVPDAEILGAASRDAERQIATGATGPQRRVDPGKQIADQGKAAARQTGRIAALLSLFKPKPIPSRAGEIGDAVEHRKPPLDRAPIAPKPDLSSLPPDPRNRRSISIPGIDADRLTVRERTSTDVLQADAEKVVDGPPKADTGPPQATSASRDSRRQPNPRTRRTGGRPPDQENEPDR